MVKILIVDDHPLVRDGLALRLSLDEDLTVCGQVGNVEEALTLVAEHQPDLALVDISLQGGNGLDLIKQIRNLNPATRMLVVSGHDESLYGERALRAGAAGYLNKQESSDKLIVAIRTILSGRRFVSTALAERLMNQALGGGGSQASETDSPAEKLTNRELEVFRAIGEGLTSGAIAEKLCISTRTVDTHRENIKRKLGLKNSGELTRSAVQWLLEQK